MRVALVHYWLVGMRGGEKVLEALCRMFPDADIFTHVHDPARISPLLNGRVIRTTGISRLPFARRLYRNYLPFMPAALEGLRPARAVGGGGRGPRSMPRRRRRRAGGSPAPT